MPPLNLELLMAGDNAEWERAYTELGLGQLALSIANAFLQSVVPRRPQFAEDIAAAAVATLWKAVKNGRINDPRGLRGLLRKITRNEAIDWFRERWFGNEIAVNFEAAADVGAAEADNERGEIADFVRQALLRYAVAQPGRPIEAVIEELADVAKLDILEKAMLQEHVVHGCTQQGFADAHNMPLGSVGRLKNEVLTKLLLDDSR